MKIWAVFIHPTGMAGEVSYSWIDSQWAKKESADARAVELDRVMRAFHVQRHKTSVVELSLVDTLLVEEQRDAK